RIDLDGLEILGSFITLFQLNFMIYIMLWAGIRIYQHVQKSAGSQRSKAIEKSTFRLLLSQAINPIILLHTPSFLNFIETQIVELPDVVNQTFCVLMNFFPVTSPLLNLMLSRDLSNALMFR
ncbi:hypothetical protein PMAYCL1PPCAC_22872, partial [Pristionchus mayeri]